MGYCTHIAIGTLALKGRELTLDMDRPFEDGSGHPYLLDEDGASIPTGRTGEWFEPLVQLSMGKIYDSELSKLHSSYREAAKGNEYFVYMYQGDTRVTEDRYGDPLVVVPLASVLDAVKRESSDWRRFSWLRALLECEMDRDSVVVFYGS